MKRKILGLVVFVSLAFCSQAQTWDEFFRQKKTQRKYLLQQIAKLQLYLGYLKKGYDIGHTGMTLISDIKQGDLTIHSFFLDHLKQISPTVKRYGKVGEMIGMYATMFNSYKSSFKKFKEAGKLSAGEIDYLYGVFTNLLDQATADMELLTGVVTDNHFEMSDDERIKCINALYESLTKKYTSLFAFTDKSHVLLLQRQKELKDLKTLQNLYQP